MAMVVEARDRRDGTHVALKLLRPMALLQPELVERLRREAHAMASLRHPNVVECLGFLDHPPVLVLELLRGESVKAALRRGRALPMPAATTIGAQVAAGLAAAHAVGLVHRDVKPSNIFLQHAPTPWAKLIDFGVAKQKEPDAPPLTSQSAVIGTALYMAPEQIRGEGATERSDVFALGLCLYEMITGERPFADGSLHLTMVRILNGEPLPEHALLPSGLHALLLRATARDAEGRPTASDLARALTPFGKRDLGRTLMSPVASVPEPAPAPERVSSVPPPPESVTRLDYPSGSQRHGTMPMQSVRPSAIPVEDMTAPLANLPPELKARLQAARPPAALPSSPRAHAAVSVEVPRSAPAAGRGKKIALGVSALTAAAGLAAGGYLLGMREAEPTPVNLPAEPASTAGTVAREAAAPSATTSSEAPLSSLAPWPAPVPKAPHREDASTSHQGAQDWGMPDAR